jgi:hypothetical protein
LQESIQAFQLPSLPTSKPPGLLVRFTIWHSFF